MEPLILLDELLLNVVEAGTFIKDFSWYVPYFATNSLSTQKSLLDRIVSILATKLVYDERSVRNKDVSNRNIRIFELGVKHFRCSVMLQWDSCTENNFFKKQHSNDSVCRPFVSSVHCIINLEKFLDVRSTDKHDKHVYEGDKNFSGKW